MFKKILITVLLLKLTFGIIPNKKNYNIPMEIEDNFLNFSDFICGYFNETYTVVFVSQDYRISLPNKNCLRAQYKFNHFKYVRFLKFTCSRKLFNLNLRLEFMQHFSK